jgi:hypothetical protein
MVRHRSLMAVFVHGRMDAKPDPEGWARIGAWRQTVRDRQPLSRTTVASDKRDFNALRSEESPIFRTFLVPTKNLRVVRETGFSNRFKRNAQYLVIRHHGSATRRGPFDRGAQAGRARVPFRSYRRK